MVLHRVPIGCISGAAVAVLLLAACASGSPGGSAEPENGGRAPDGPAATEAQSDPDVTTSTTSTTTSTTTTEPPRVPDVTTATELDDLSAGAAAWSEVAAAERVEIVAGVDGSAQPAMWVPPSGDVPAPLVVVLPSWSYGHEAAAAVPIARWATRSGWALLQPDARGPSGRPESTGSDLVVSDVVDAIDWAIDQGGVDPDRVVLMGYSGGAMTALVVGARHPQRVAGVAAFSPIYDLVRWYDDMRGWNDLYADDIRRACGGDPLRDPAAHDECRHRSPAGHLDAAREHGLPIYVGQGDRDAVTFPDHARDVYRHARDPDEVERRDGVEHHFTADDPEVHSARSTGAVVLVEFGGEHDLVYNPALAWMTELVSDPDADP